MPQSTSDDIRTNPLGKRGHSTAEAGSLPPAVAPNSELPGTIISIQVLRFVAAFMVVLFHAHVALVGKLPNHIAGQVDHAFEVGASGVHIFFVISGFVMVYTSIRSRLNSIGFLKRRLIRIYPIYWVVFVAYVVAHQLLGSPYQHSAGEIGLASLLFPGFSALVIGPGWTLSFEMYFYLCFALALVAGVRNGLLALSIFYVLSVLIGRTLQVSPGQVLTDSLLLEFVAGAWLGVAYSRGFAVSQRTGAAFVMVAVVLFGSGFWLDYHSVPSIVSWGIPSLLLVTGALAFEPKLRSSRGRFFGRLGDSSYLLYLSHVLIIDLFLATPIALLNGSEYSAVVIALPFALACTAIAAGGYRTIELPLLKLLKRATLSTARTSSQRSAAVQ